jgi:protoporphyrinogen/coproporphyrinogen III oxidase
MNAPRVAVVGAGIAGLAAAHRLRTLLGPGAAITLLEQRDRIGGVLRTVDLAGRPYDVGAEAFLARRPEVQALLAELGLVERLVHPTAAGASIRAAGRTVPLPGGTVLGVPTSGARLAGLLSHSGLAAAAAEPARPLAWSPGGDAALGPLLRARFGDELTDRLVDPLLGGVYAGRVDVLGLRPTMPALAAALDAGASSLTAAADAVVPPPRGESHGGGSNGQNGSRGTGSRGAPSNGAAADSATHPVETADSPSDGAAGAQAHPGESLGGRAESPAHRGEMRDSPVFGGLRGGYRVLLDALADAAHADLRLGTTVRAIEPSAAGWLLVLGPTTAPEALEVDAVVLAVPAPAVARLLRPVAPAAADAAAGIELASSVVVALAFREEDVPAPATSGALVAAGEPLSVKGVTHSSTKWAHLGGDGFVRLRASLGRFGEAAALQADDETLIGQVLADLAVLDGIHAAPVAVHVQRWGGGLPQYAPGHVGRIATLEAGLPDGIAVAGAALHGVGVPACVGTGRAAAERLARAVVSIG